MNTPGRRIIIGCDGREVAPDQLPFEALSLGRGVFETMLVVDGRIAFRRKHADRLANSCVALGIASRENIEALFAHAEAVARDSKSARGRMRVSVVADAGREPVALVAVREAAACQPLSLRPADVRRFAGDPLACHKTVNYLGNLLLRDEARRYGFDDALLSDSEGLVAETTTANIFLSIDGRIVTPRLGCILPGIVRAWIINTSATLGVQVEEFDIPDTDLPRAVTAFATNCVIGIAPVRRIGDRVLQDALAQDWFRILREAYEKAVQEV